MDSSNRFVLIKRLLNRLSYFMPGGYTVRPWIHRVRGAHIGDGVWISQFVYIDEIHPEAVTIEDNCSIGLRSSIFAHFYWGPRKARESHPVTIGCNAFIGPHCLILPGVTIGEGAVIKAGTVVSRSVPPRTLWGPPEAAPLATTGVPLTSTYSYSEFISGLRTIEDQVTNTK